MAITTISAPGHPSRQVEAAEAEINSRLDEFHGKAQQALVFLNSVGTGIEDPTPAQTKALFRITYDLVRAALAVEVRLGRDAKAAKVMQDTDLTGGS